MEMKAHTVKGTLICSDRPKGWMVSGVGLE